MTRRLIDPAGFAAFAPAALPGTLGALETAATLYGLDRPLVLAHWLGQMRVESGGYRVLAESLHYSVDSLIRMFGRHRISVEDAQQFGRTKDQPANQSAIANLIYGGEWGRVNLGNTMPGDGWRFRGGGFKQITGRANYREAGFEEEPSLLRQDVESGARASANFFVRHDCLRFAEADDVAGVTLKVNGGANGLQERIAATAAAKRIVS